MTVDPIYGRRFQDDRLRAQTLDDAADAFLEEFPRDDENFDPADVFNWLTDRSARIRQDMGWAADAETQGESL